VILIVSCYNCLVCRKWLWYSRLNGNLLSWLICFLFWSTIIHCLFQTHCWDCGTDIEDTLHALNDVVRTGKVHYIGVSNVTGWQLQKIVDINKKFGYPQIVSLQVQCCYCISSVCSIRIFYFPQAQYSLLCRQTEWELVQVCQHEKISMLPCCHGALWRGKLFFLFLL